jgi:transcriptional regulator with XRE-family HTH domain
MRIMAALEGSGLAESDLERVVAARRSWVARWLEGANVRSSREIEALFAVRLATGVSLDWIVVGKETNALRDKARVAQIRGCLCREPVVNIEIARAVMRPDKQTIGL